MMLRFAAAALAALLAHAAPAGALMTLRPGDKPPAFALPDLTGKSLALESLAGRPAAVLFWSTWSPRSAEMLEDFKRHHAAYAGKGLQVVAVNIEGENLDAAKKAAVREFAAARALPFPVLLDEGLATFSSWGVMAHPTEVILDREGRIAYVLPGYPLSLREELKERIEQALGVAPPPARPELPAVGHVPEGGALRQYNLGLQLLGKDDPERALAAFRRAAAADPGFLDAAILTARVSLLLGNLEEAEQLARTVSPDAVNRGDLGFLLGLLLLRKGDLDAAEAAFAALREKLPREGWGPWGIGLVALSRGDRAAALAAMEAAQAMEAGNHEAEDAVRRHFRDLWMRRGSAPEEEGFVRLFPGLAELRERYRRLYSTSGG